MITPEEIKKKARKQYIPYCLSCLNGTTLFPLVIPGNKGKSTDPFMERGRGLAALVKEAKSRKGYGYTLEMEEVNTRDYGPQSVVKRIFFETPGDFLKFTGMEKAFKAFTRVLSLIRNELPELEDWLPGNIKYISPKEAVFSDLLKVCRWFMNNPSPDLYIREIPVKVHTKFVEENIPVLSSLLEALLPRERINEKEKSFPRRFNLRWDEPLIRCRFTGKDGEEDISRPLGLFKKRELPGNRAFIIENKINFLTFPADSNTLVIWGKGFGAGDLKKISWLERKELYYWGDIDPPGLKILSLVRSHYPRLRSFLMDRNTYDTFKEFAVFCDKNDPQPPGQLTKEEKELYLHLKTHPSHGRLEQERIPQDYLKERLSREE